VRGNPARPHERPSNLLRSSSRGLPDDDRLRARLRVGMSCDLPGSAVTRTAHAL
jgi:hypothetical protein